VRMRAGGGFRADTGGPPRFTDAAIRRPRADVLMSLRCTADNRSVTK
jgi:hypothetical protein